LTRIESEVQTEDTADVESTGGRLLLFLAMFLGLVIVAAGIVYWVQARPFPVVAAI
jgi:hypothetical protein